MSNRKLLLAHIRNGNYAHAGEEEAIELVLSFMTKNPHQKMLDIGCGLGGTADYIEKQGFGKVIGIDVDQSVLKKANELYPHIQFHLCDANTSDAFFKDQKFDVLYSFNAFFCFKTQENCLKAFSEAAQINADLLIFDYSSPGGFSQASPFHDRTQSSTASTSFFPINLSTIEDQLSRSNWKLNNIINLDKQYR